MVEEAAGLSGGFVVVDVRNAVAVALGGAVAPVQPQRDVAAQAVELAGHVEVAAQVVAVAVAERGQAVGVDHHRVEFGIAHDGIGGEDAVERVRHAGHGEGVTVEGGREGASVVA